MKRRTSITLSPEAYELLMRIRGGILIKKHCDITLSSIVDTLIMFLGELLKNRDLFEYVRSKVTNEKVREFLNMVEHIGE